MSHSLSNWLQDHVSRTIGVQAREDRGKHSRRPRRLRFHQLEDRRMMSALPWAAALDSPALSAARVGALLITGPKVVNPAHATVSLVTGTNTSLSVLATDAAGAAKLTYTWSTTSAPSGAPAPVFSVNGNNAAQNTTVSFGAAGVYTFTATITDPLLKSAISTVTLTVAQTLNKIAVTPSTVSLLEGGTQQFTATGLDQFGNPLAATTFAWTTTVGAITNAGLLTAPADSGNGTVTVTSGAITTKASVTVLQPPPATLLYSTTSVGGGSSIPNTLISVNPKTGAQQVVGPIGQTAEQYSLTADPSSGYLYGVDEWDRSGVITAINPVTGACSVAATLPASIEAIAFSPAGQLYGILGNNTLCTIDLANDSVSDIGTIAGKGLVSSIAFSPQGTLYAAEIDQNPLPQSLLTLNPATAAIITSKSISGNLAVGDLDYAPDGYLYATNFSWALGRIDPATGNEILVGFGSLGALGGLVTAIGAPPVSPATIQSPASAAPVAVTGTTTTLAVLGAVSDLSANSLIYTGAATTLPHGAPAPTFSANGSNAAQQTTATFGEAGVYGFTVTVTAPDGLTATSSVSVTVNQTLSSLTVSPALMTLKPETAEQFTATGLDQFGNPLPLKAGVSWSANVGTITSGGLYTAPATAGSAIVTAACGRLQGIASVTISGTNFLGLNDPVLAALVQSLDAEGSISRDDVIQILRSVDRGNLSAADFSDLQTIVADAGQLNMPNYVEVLASDVVEGNAANAHYQGLALGNLAAGSSAVVQGDLIGKWFLGTDLPAADAGTNGANYSYGTASGSLFAGTPSHNEEIQGYVGDCYLISALGSLADASPAAVKNMFLDNDDGTWTVRFYDNGTADYVTVNAMLPVNSAGQFVYADCGCLADNRNNVLWIPLAEKAYVEWDETGNEGRDGVNAYSDIAGGWMSTVYAQVLGQSAGSFGLVTAGDEAALVNAMTNHWAASIGTDCQSNLPYGLYGCHAYAVIGYNTGAGTFTLYNPWGCDQPTSSLTWAELQTVCDGFCTANPAGSEPINAVGQNLQATTDRILAAGTMAWTRPADASLLGSQADSDAAIRYRRTVDLILQGQV
jgi:hypothetical protein